nr:phosphopantetheine-binding protein [Kibdelosporangium sp. MJ126-NF4]CEL14734.1 hypothetical protein [Kibdelosporangium sp. MJ126-NF4]CTQ96636.1 hypothetical protein [Kibdelosporangium sp. MJ126-NF4]
MTTREEVFSVVRGAALAVDPALEADQIRPDVALADLGFSSLDRMDVVCDALDQLGLPLDAELLAGVSNLGELVDAVHAAACRAAS